MRKKLISKLIAAGLALNLTFFFYPQDKLVNNISSVAYAADNVSLPTNTKDGAILHAFDWSFNTIKSELSNIATAGYKSIQVSPVQGTKESSTDPSKWWLLYQPTNQSIGNSQLGSYDDFKSLCTEAEKYGISIIVDVVMNHMAGTGESLANQVDSSFKNSNYYHNKGQCSNWNNRYDITQLGIGMPDLNTQNPEVQSKAISFLNQCVAAGADGFRFDAAKHIETNIGLDVNQSWSGNYWTNVLGNLNNKSNLFIYGEILQDGKVDNVSAYESFMNVTASSYGYSLRNAINSNNLSSIGTGFSGIDSNKAVDFVETHDTYEDGTTKGLTTNQIKLGWAIAAARNSATPLFFNRPTSSIGNEGDSLWKDADIVAINKFRNAMVGQPEYLRWTNNSSTMLIDRGTKGTVIVNSGSNTYISSPTNLANGTYTNQGSASCTLTVSNGTISGNIPAGSVIVLDNYSPNPVDTVSWSPTTPIAGQTVKVTYDSTNRPLQNSSSVKIHYGYDGFTGATDAPMTSEGNNKWSITLTVPSSTKSKLDFCFTNGSSWDNNGSTNWNIPIKSSSTTFMPRVGYTVDYDNTTLTKGSSFTIYYNGTLTNSSKVTLHWGYNGWINPADVVMTKDSYGFWEGKVTIPTSATKLDFCFNNGSNWDNNSNSDWHLTVN
ncbi:carbohydrate-binding protein [Clostridium sp. SHJSY1]|uniref:carbohydrate-binding protein n=1 Tax=Clostridium sp. SHJSY1 TaxID=2942483 RepID=UPI0028751C0D|nr:carbohydrate-binding protein [Clostridium sp. SHJSY1]MDS0526140.1 carbohydrate-binding protein [Clostridium sp. SHJSY1]